MACFTLKERNQENVFGLICFLADSNKRVCMKRMAQDAYRAAAWISLNNVGGGFQGIFH